MASQGLARSEEEYTTTEQEYTSQFVFSKSGVTLVSYVLKKGKLVLLVSTMHDRKEINVEMGEKKKPEIICF
jgi:hypothetical protein